MIAPIQNDVASRRTGFLWTERAGVGRPVQAGLRLGCAGNGPGGPGPVTLSAESSAELLAASSYFRDVACQRPYGDSTSGGAVNLSRSLIPQGMRGPRSLR